MSYSDLEARLSRSGYEIVLAADKPKDSIYTQPIPSNRGAMDFLSDAQFIADMSSGKYSISEKYMAKAVGASSVETVVISDKKGIEFKLEMKDYFPKGIAVDQLVLSPKGSDLYVVASGLWGNSGGRSRIFKADISSGIKGLKFEEIVKSRIILDSQTYPDIGPDGTLYFVVGQTKEGLAFDGYISKIQAGKYSMLTTTGWINVDGGFNTTIDGKLKPKVGGEFELIVGRKPTVAYDSTGKSWGIFFEQGKVVKDSVLPSICYANDVGKISILNPSSITQNFSSKDSVKGLISVDEFLHRVYDNGNIAAGFIHKGLGTIEDNVVKANGNYIITYINPNQDGAFNFKSYDLILRYGTNPKPNIKNEI